MVEGSGPESEREDPAIAKLSARFLHLSMAAAREAFSDARLDDKDELIDPHRVAVVIGSAFGGLDLLDAEQERMSRRRSLAVSPYLVPAMIINQAAGQIAQHLEAVWSQCRAGERVRFGWACGRSGGDVPAIGRRRPRPLRRRRECVHAGGGQWIRDDEGASGTQAGRSIGRRSGAGQPPVQP